MLVSISRDHAMPGLSTAVVAHNGMGVVCSDQIVNHGPFAGIAESKIDRQKYMCHGDPPTRCGGRASGWRVHLRS
jgi:hypothetical protein